MSAWVAVVFREESLESLLLHRVLYQSFGLQTNKDEATVYSLVAKRRYFGKTETKDYNLAFGDLTRL